MPQTKYISYVPGPATMKRIGALHVRLYRLSFGLLGGRLDGLNMLLLTTTGKKTGKERTVPLPFFRDGDRYVLIASFGGNAKNPAWFANLLANPRVQIQIGARRMQAQAVVLEGAERARVWGKVSYDFPRYLTYQAKTDREIPVVLLQPL
jgi:deazaflavin-dependent oxidoreductase (nitroreductase family)